MSPAPPTGSSLRRWTATRAVAGQRRAALPAGELRDQMERVSQGLIPYVGGAHILTDDKAPVELLGMRAIDDLIQQELAYYQEIYREEGLSGLLNRF